MIDHLSALELRLSNERLYLSQAATEAERKLRRAWIGQIEREIAGEKTFLGASLPEMTDSELIEALKG